MSKISEMIRLSRYRGSRVEAHDEFYFDPSRQKQFFLQVMWAMLALMGAKRFLHRTLMASRWNYYNTWLLPFNELTPYQWVLRDYPYHYDGFRQRLSVYSESLCVNLLVAQTSGFMMLIVFFMAYAMEEDPDAQFILVLPQRWQTQINHYLDLVLADPRHDDFKRRFVVWQTSQSVVLPTMVEGRSKMRVLVVADRPYVESRRDIPLNIAIGSKLSLILADWWPDWLTRSSPFPLLIFMPTLGLFTWEDGLTLESERMRATPEDATLITQAFEALLKKHPEHWLGWQELESYSLHVKLPRGIPRHFKRRFKNRTITVDVPALRVILE